MARPITHKPSLPIEIDAEGLGPAMRALTPGRQAFVVAKVFYGANNAEAARMAGFALSRAKSTGHMLAHTEAVQAAILEEGRKLMRAEGPRSIHTLVAIRDDKDADAKDRIKCAVELLNRSGFHAVSEHHEHQHHHLSEAEQDKRILALCAELGLGEAEARKMLIAPAEFERNAEGVFELSAAPLSDKASNASRRATRARRAGMTPAEIEADKARIRAEQADSMRQERAAHDAARAAETIAALSPQHLDNGVSEK